MNNKLIVATALIAGIVGGLLTRYIAPPPVFAQAPAPSAAPAKIEIRAQEFTLVDEFDSTVGTFTAEPGGMMTPKGRGYSMHVVLRDSNGKVMWTAGSSAIRPAMTKSN